MRHLTTIQTVALAAALLGVTACTTQDSPDVADPTSTVEQPSEPLTIYSGRSQELVGWVFEELTAETGIELDVRYGNTAELAATIMEEGDASPADLYFAQDAGALGALESAGRLRTLPDDVLELLDANFRAPSGAWTGVTGRVRVLAYNTDTMSTSELPDSVFDLTDASWRGRVGWAPENGSFQAFVTAMRITEGEDTTRDWLEAMLANETVAFANNTGAVEGVARGEVDVALVNHYYLFRFLAEDPDFNVANHYLPGDIGGLVNVAGIGVLDTSDQTDAAYDVVRFLLSEDVQAYFGQVTDALEFPLRDGVDAPDLPALDELSPPAVDLSRLEDLQATLELLREVGAFE
ncbi:MAG: iron ABC transporter substrate-binding protein [Nitriliruptoraceae bacterium]